MEINTDTVCIIHSNFNGRTGEAALGDPLNGSIEKYVTKLEIELKNKKFKKALDIFKKNKSEFIYTKCGSGSSIHFDIYNKKLFQNVNNYKVQKIQLHKPVYSDILEDMIQISLHCSDVTEFSPLFGFEILGQFRTLDEFFEKYHVIDKDIMVEFQLQYELELLEKGEF